MSVYEKLRDERQLTEFFPHTLELSEVSLVLALVFDLLLDTLKNADGRRIVINPAGGTESGLDDSRA